MGQEDICRKKNLGKQPLALRCFSMVDTFREDKAQIVARILCRPIGDIAKKLSFTLMSLIRKKV